MSRKLLMYVTKKSDKLGIDNRTLETDKLQEKLSEEFEEVQIAIDNYRLDKRLSNLKEVIKETFDLIQVCIIILKKCKRKADDLDEPNLIEELNEEHNDKLKYRKWEFGETIEINIKE